MKILYFIFIIIISFNLFAETYSCEYKELDKLIEKRNDYLIAKLKELCDSENEEALTTFLFKNSGDSTDN